MSERKQERKREKRDSNDELRRIDDSEMMIYYGNNGKYNMFP